jgi:hypothetical protein
MTIAKEKYDTKLQQMINSFQIKRASESVLNRAVNRNENAKSEDDSENSSSKHTSRSSSEEKKEGEDEEVQIKRYFFIDRYNEE